MFTPATLDFLTENRFMNSREWYQANRDTYKAVVLQPMIEFAEALAPTLEKIDPQIITEPKVDKTISRIYRDMRYARGELYRDEMWLSFKRDKHMYPGYPEFFFAFSPQSFCCGCGYYAASAETMECLRQLVLTDHPAYLAAQKALDAQQVFFMDGDLYKRSKYPEQDAVRRNWLDRKNICLLHEGARITDLFAPELAKKTAASFYAIRSVYALFIEAEQQANELKVF